MIWITTRRIIKAGFINFWRNGSVSLSAVFVMVVVLFMIGSTLLTTAFLGTALKELEDKIDINIYLTATASEEHITALREQLLAQGSSSRTSTTTRCSAWRTRPTSR
jgi:cell division protein FtsX